MKKLFAFLMIAMLLCLSLTACGNESKKESDDNTNSSIQSSQTSNIQESQKEDETWGVDESIITERNDKKARAYIKFPFLAGITEGQGKVAYQTDGSLVILGSEIDYKEPEINDRKAENIFPAYFEKVIGMMTAYRRVDHENFNFEILNKETLKVNDYDMCKYTGKHTFTVNGNKKSISYVAYATKLKSNDAAVYWMVLDDTEEQTLGSTIESHAEKMAESLHE